MDNQERILHLEHLIEKLRLHVTQQDAEIFKLSKRIDSMSKNLDRLEKRIQDASPESPLDSDVQPSDERPPHY